MKDEPSSTPHCVSVCVYVELHIQSLKAKTNFQFLVLQKHDFFGTFQIACKIFAIQNQATVMVLHLFVH